ncbi:hypothetical protein KIH86_09895 [Paenibacillus sp. HN-1]|uniref:hypothetical protein n=1 Tax=Paenibacillus TaxID=44249 RepID=UPI001CAA101E|nr:MULTISPECIES: hypothetical protein [Paenibacillus]MBY9079901.1 hypothetical protein [Paenibacillus sp. CGMCC 1.18879]MBY9084542.1 hypothetical protein [Paenibacillus sinensis]
MGDPAQSRRGPTAGPPGGSRLSRADMTAHKSAGDPGQSARVQDGGTGVRRGQWTRDGGPGAEPPRSDCRSTGRQSSVWGGHDGAQEYRKPVPDHRNRLSAVSRPGIMSGHYDYADNEAGRLQC